jgi:hypothetical protein
MRTAPPFRRIWIISALLMMVAPVTRAQSCLGDIDPNGFSISIDTVAENIGMVTGPLGSTDLTGFNCYRLYVACPDPTDLLQSVAGDNVTPTSITTSTTFFQHPLGSATESTYNPFLFAAYPDLEYDSFLSIGLTQPAVTANGEATPLVAEDGATSPISGAFESGQSLILNTAVGSSWFVADAEAATNCQAGPDQQVFFAQVTTDGDLGGLVQFQMFRGTVGANTCVRPYLPVNPGNLPGCTDSDACNFDPAATADDGSCDFCSCLDTILQSTVTFPQEDFPAYVLEIDVTANHDTTGLAGLAGMKTYRMYVRTAEAGDRVTAAFGNEIIPLELSSTTSFFNATIGGATPNTIYPTLFSTPGFEDTQYDSWVTIGMDRASAFLGGNYGDISTIGEWVPVFEPGGGQPGGNVFVNDVVGGTWFTFPNLDNAVPDADQRVLIGQFTSDGIISGTLGLQILPETPPANTSEVDYRLRFDFTTEFLDDQVLPICGCTDTNALNFDPAANVDDGSCFPFGCTYPAACNFDPLAVVDDGSCEYPAFGLDCAGNCLVDTDGDGICEVADPCIGTEDECGVCNGPGAIYDCGCFEQPDNACDCDGNALDALGVCGGTCASDADEDGICDTDEIPGCTQIEACNFSPEATDDDGSCDLSSCFGCTDTLACNYDPSATVSDSTCAVPGPCEICENGQPITVSDADGDGICDENEVPGCTWIDAINFDPEATDNDGSCNVLGCTDSTAQNFNDQANLEDGSCAYPCTGIAGCTYPDAVNFEDAASCDDGSCTFDCSTSSGSCVLDYDGNGLIGANDLVYFLSWFELPCEP